MKQENFETQQVDTKQRILDAAEHLFAHEGFKGTSLRDVTGRAGVNLAAVNYHFGSKEALLRAVMERRLIPLNQVRIERITKVRDSALQKGQRPPVKELLRAFIEPTLQFKESSPGAEDFVALVGRSFSDPDDTVRNVFMKLIWPLFQLIFETFHEALPELSEKTLLWRLHFMFGAFSQTMHICCGRFHSDTIKMPLENDSKTIISMFIPFITAGMHAK
ncbi:MAG: TetR/AcrR family transcriptional regulator [Nitrospiraceae bacterium]|nr:MAG: TetR/AcrR family transcriptional regulator [Nitrospiraceae bacterium]